MGPAKPKPVPDTVAREMVILDLPVLATPTGTIRVLPTCTLPKLTLGPEIDNWALAALEIKSSTSEEKTRIQQVRPWWGPRRLISFALFLHVLVEHGGGLLELRFLRRVKIHARGPIRQ